MIVLVFWGDLLVFMGGFLWWEGFYCGFISLFVVWLCSFEDFITLPWRFIVWLGKLYLPHFDILCWNYEIDPIPEDEFDHRKCELNSRLKIINMAWVWLCYLCCRYDHDGIEDQYLRMSLTTPSLPSMAATIKPVLPSESCRWQSRLFSSSKSSTCFNLVNTLNSLLILLF